MLRLDVYELSPDVLTIFDDECSGLSRHPPSTGSSTMQHTPVINAEEPNPIVCLQTGMNEDS